MHKRTKPPSKAAQYSMALSKIAGMSPGSGLHGAIYRAAHLSIEAGIAPETYTADLLMVSSRAEPRKTQEIEESLKEATARKEAEGYNPDDDSEDAPPPVKKRRRRKMKPLPEEEVFRGSMSFEDLRADSPIWIPEDPAEQSILWLNTLYYPDEYLFIQGDTPEDKLPPRRGYVGQNIMTIADWTDRINRQGVLDEGTFVLANPLSGQPDADGSFRSTAVTTEGRFILFEYDDPRDVTPEERQAHLNKQAWFLYTRADCLGIQSIVYSGRKSLHALCRVGLTKEEYQDRMLREGDGPLNWVSRFIIRYGADDKTKSLCRATRFAGGYSHYARKSQELLWLRDTSDVPDHMHSISQQQTSYFRPFV